MANVTLTKEQLAEAKKLLRAEHSVAEVCAETGLTERQVHKIRAAYGFGNIRDDVRAADLATVKKWVANSR